MKDVLAAVLDTLVPEDELGPGALAAGVLEFVERALEGTLPELRSTYDEGLTALDGLARAADGRSFADLDVTERVALLARVESGAYGTGPQSFFELVRLHTVQGMFADPVHGGNRGGVGWRLIGFPGPKTVFTEHDQALDVEIEPAPLP